ncbi:unnamed protein product [Linum trigynum]|uniref:Uncharacterized protein n=1 Tax=Linum trigynum TaxID=586398 RepID=A0AAV2GX05_9ROSI
MQALSSFNQCPSETPSGEKNQSPGKQNLKQKWHSFYFRRRRTNGGKWGQCFASRFNGEGKFTTLIPLRSGFNSIPDYLKRPGEISRSRSRRLR